MTSNGQMFLLVFVVSTISAKYIYVNQQKTWDNARSHCLNSYTDLAPISNDYDRKLLITQNPQALSETSWIGLTRSASDYLKWVWVGGGAVQENKTFWSSGEPNDWNGKEDKGVIYGNGLQWNDEDGDSDFPFFCYKVHILSLTISRYIFASLLFCGFFLWNFTCFFFFFTVYECALCSAS
uniref:C-type lectin domain-containing protein n=1 Tax=Periophthalmus magnuspinnatus TaxID=409849 RepID=A0A3B3ZEN7_9GOBI